MFSSNQIDLLCNFFVKNIPSMKSQTFAGGTNSATATGRRFKKGTEFLDLENFIMSALAGAACSSAAIVQ